MMALNASCIVVMIITTFSFLNTPFTISCSLPAFPQSYLEWR